MKLKLETQDGVAILSITENIAVQHAAVIKAGLNKIFSSGMKTVLLDLTALPTADPAALQEVSALQVWAQDQNAMVMVASPVPGIGHASTRQETLMLLTSPMAKLLTLEAKLKAQVRTFEKQKFELEQKLAASGAQDPKQLQKENSDLKKMIADLETVIQSLLKGRNPPLETDLMRAKNEVLMRTMVMILEQQGVLPVT